MISPQLLAIVRCPECHAPLSRDGDRITCSGCSRSYRASGSDFLDLRPSVEYAEQTKYLDEALHAEAEVEVGGQGLRHAAKAPRPQVREEPVLGPQAIARIRGVAEVHLGEDRA